MRRRADAAGVGTPEFVHAPGLNSEAFIWYSRFGRTARAYGVGLAGSAKLEAHRHTHQEKYRLTATDDAVAALANAATSCAPRHMRSEVDRAIFGRDLDKSEEDGGGIDNVLLSRLPPEVREGGGQRPASAMLPAVRRGEPVGRLHVGQALGASRPSVVRPRPSSAHPAAIIHAQRQTREFQEELEKLYRRAAAHDASRARKPRGRPAWVQ